jgi:23S rRNA C2498 (ribose-2'-O)-methylase RlmM
MHQEMFLAHCLARLSERFSSIAGVIGNASSAAFGSDTWHEGDGNRLIRTMPFNNVLFVRQLFKEAGDGIDRVMGAQ